MPGAFLERDMRIFFNPREFADHLVVVSGRMAGSRMTCQFSRPGSEAFGGASSQPECTVPSSAVLDLVEEDRIEVEGQGAFKVDAIDPDGHGVTRLTLAETA